MWVVLDLVWSEEYQRFYLPGLPASSSPSESVPECSNTGTSLTPKKRSRTRIQRLSDSVDTVIYSAVLPEPNTPSSHEVTLEAMEVLARLAELLTLYHDRAIANNRQPEPEESPFSFKGSPLYLQPHGAKGWPYILKNEWLTVEAGAGGASRTVGRVTVSSLYLHSEDIDVVTDAVVRFIYEFFGEGVAILPSNVQMKTDFTGVDFGNQQQWANYFGPRFYCRAPIGPTNYAKKLPRDIQTIRAGKIGRTLSAQFYDKTAEIREQSPEKVYMHDIWRSRGWDGESKVWRLEARFEREWLRKHAINDPYTLLDYLAAMWMYLTSVWLQFKEIDGRLRSIDMETLNAASIAPWWVQMQSWDGDATPHKLAQVTARVASAEASAVMGAAHMISYHAKRDGMPSKVSFMQSCSDAFDTWQSRPRARTLSSQMRKVRARYGLARLA